MSSDPLLHPNHDWNELYHPVIPIPLHLFQIFKESLIEAGVVLSAKGCLTFPTFPDDAGTVLHHHSVSGSGGRDKR